MPGSSGYHWLSKTFHWLTALAVLGMICIGWWMTGLALGLFKLQVYTWHKWIGLTVLALTLLCLLWRRRVPPPDLPDTIAPWERKLAPLVHWSLLALLLAMPISGWAMNSAAAHDQPALLTIDLAHDRVGHDHALQAAVHPCLQHLPLRCCRPKGRFAEIYCQS